MAHPLINSITREYAVNSDQVSDLDNSTPLDREARERYQQEQAIINEWLR